MNWKYEVIEKIKKLYKGWYKNNDLRKDLTT